MNRLKIEIQYFDGCPNSVEFISRVKKVLESDEIIECDYTETLVSSDEMAKEVKFRGSPTLLINGKDFEDLPEPKEPALMCRYYPLGLPGVNEIKMRIKQFV